MTKNFTYIVRVIASFGILAAFTFAYRFVFRSHGHLRNVLQSNDFRLVILLLQLFRLCDHVDLVNSLRLCHRKVSLQLFEQIVVLSILGSLSSSAVSHLR